MNYSIDYKVMGIWIAVAVALSSSISLFMTYNSQNSQNYQISLDEDTTPGELTRLSVNSASQPVQGANISIDGEFIGTTNSQGIKGFETPENNFTVKASKDDISSKTTFTFEDGSFSSPDDFDGDLEDEDSSDGSDSDGDGSDNYSEDSDNQDSNQDSSEDDQQDSSDAVDDFTGIEIDEEPMIGELRTITVYDEGEEVSGAEVTVNGELVGTTNAGGTVKFGVPNAAEVSVSTDTGLSETFTVQDYTEDDQNQIDDQNDTEDDSPHGIQLDSDPVSGTTNRIILYDQGDRVSGETVYLDGNELGQTSSNGAIEFEVPLQEQIIVTTDYGLESQTFNITEYHLEPDIILLSPEDSSEFDTIQGETTDVTFEADVDTEESGTASLIIDGSEVYTQDLSTGTTTVSATQSLSPGSHSWSVEVDTPEFNTSSSTRSLSVTEAESQESLELQGNATAEEFVTVALYQNNEPVQGEELFVNQESIGTTDEFGELHFQVPNTQEITITTQSGIDEITRAVEGYDASDPVSVNFISPEGEINGYKTDVILGFEAEEDVDYSVVIDDDVRYDDSLSSGDSDEFNTEIAFEQGLHQLYVNWSSGSKTNQTDPIEFETTEERPPAEVSLNTPEGGYNLTEYEGTKRLGYEIVDYESGDLSLILNGTVLQTHNLKADSDINYFDYSLSHSEDISGYNEWYIEYDSGGSSISSEKRVIEVE